MVVVLNQFLLISCNTSVNKECWNNVLRFVFNFETKKRQINVYNDHSRNTYQLVGDISVVIASHAFSDGRFHQSRQGRQNVDWWVNLQHRDK